ncbi:MAG: carboxypeptidase-like regulatory domain-containing protein, partial [Cyclobacteriaceae bacterium]|nr:carboxypeptidase-like regulatory domain-containing protein [Cyclobacteriaceae bacterium HetDA_MAG_MS6]
MTKFLHASRRLLLILCLLRLGSLPAQGIQNMLLTMADTEVSHRADFQGEKKVRPLSYALIELEEMYEINISYDPEIVQGKKVSKTLNKSETLEDNLDDLLIDQGLHFKKLEKGYYVVLSIKERHDFPKEVSAPTSDREKQSSKRAPKALQRLSKNLSVGGAEDQDLTIKGKVTDDDGEELPGVSVLIKGTTVGTITDIDGNYTLTTPAGSGTLVFSYVGFKTIEI